MVYVDDTIIAGPDPTAIDALITSLGIADEEHRQTFDLRDEGEVGDFLGIRIEKAETRKFVLSQTGLITKVIKETNMEDCNPCKTPASITPLHKDEDGELFRESWDYATVVGMLLFLSNNTRPDIAYAVSQVARFTHNPKESHAKGIKRIIRYLKGTSTEGMTISPSN